MQPERKGGNVALTRESLRNGILREILLAEPNVTHILSEEELQASLRATLEAAPSDACTRDGVWVFGYGSLIWNPAFLFEEKRIGTLHGYHRQFCLWTHLGRGSPDNPGLVLGLEAGGCCRGMAFRIAPENVEEEFHIIWQREMVSGAYCPRWVSVTVGDQHLTAVSFIINRQHPRYARKLPEDTIVQAIATACGKIGHCSEYLLNTVEHLEELGIEDRKLRHLAERVEARLEAEGCGSEAPD